MGPNFSKLGVWKDTSVSFTTRPSVSTKPLGQANLTFTDPEVEENPIPVICEKKTRAGVGPQCLHVQRKYLRSLIYTFCGKDTLGRGQFGVRARG